MRLLLILALLLLVAGSSIHSTEHNTKPFIMSYELNKVDSKHQVIIEPWLVAAKNDPVIKLHTYETKDGYKYTYAKGYKDVEVSYIYQDGEGQLKQSFKKGLDTDEILVVIQYNPSICCITNIYETDDHNYQYPDDFNFVFSYGVQSKNKLDTFMNTFTIDLIVDGSIDVALELTEDEMKRIYEKMAEINFFEYPEYSAGVISEPSTGYIFVVERNGEQQTVGWSGGFSGKLKDQEFKSLVDLIIKIIQSHEVYKSLPEAQGGYL